ncbi:hypothetical protein CDD81_996 [Ophiocordyceps australis]|uniref:AB hydrolase-1 domain-containing protein n=1 Tax=Ophiocordyceps australis TaxID=1399860 RepID=A0A2C5Y277_9HYPO|nr:hypothetical protein CDD81_996 [Ophiocordyceps australis]
MTDYKTFNLGDWPLESGASLPNAFIAYKTYGDKSLPAIIYPTWFSGSIADNEWLISPAQTLSPHRFFIIVPALFGNGQSTSPSNSPHRPFPSITLRDNVRAQHDLVTRGLGVENALCVLGWSMGAGQTYEWIVQFPDFCKLAVPFCGSARTALHNQVFLEGVKAALLAAKGVASNGSGANEQTDEWTREQKQVGLKAMARVYAGWGFSQTFYRQKLYQTELGYKDLEHFMVEYWEAWGLSKDPQNILVMLNTWQRADCSKNETFKGDFERAMMSIKAKTLVLPGQTDLYFPPEDSEYEVQCMGKDRSKCVAFPSVWGHWAGGPGLSKTDLKWLDGILKAFLLDGQLVHGRI